jgi:plasmid stabilization system protein ParE
MQPNDPRQARLSLPIEKSSRFQADVTSQFRWYLTEAGEEVAWQFLAAVDVTLAKLGKQPEMGNARRFRNPRLQGLRSFRVEPPFDKLLLFYRSTGQSLQAWRLMHGARDLPLRLAPPAAS